MDGTYYVRMDTGSLKDMNGVDMYVLDSRAFTLPTGEAAIHTFTTPTSRRALALREEYTRVTFLKF